MTTNGILTTLGDFNKTNGFEVKTGVTFGPDGNLYGTAWAGGSTDTNAAGAIYRLDVDLAVTNQPPRISWSVGGAVTLHLASIPGSTNQLWATTNLSLPLGQWQVLATNVASNGFFDFTDTNTSGVKMKFYRLSTP